MPHRVAVLEMRATIERDLLIVLCLCEEPWLSRTAWKDKATAGGGPLSTVRAARVADQPSAAAIFETVFQLRPVPTAPRRFQARC